MNFPSSSYKLSHPEKNLVCWPSFPHTLLHTHTFDPVKGKRKSLSASLLSSHRFLSWPYGGANQKKGGCKGAFRHKRKNIYLKCFVCMAANDASCNFWNWYILKTRPCLCPIDYFWLAPTWSYKFVNECVPKQKNHHSDNKLTAASNNQEEPQLGAQVGVGGREKEVTPPPPLLIGYRQNGGGGGGRKWLLEKPPKRIFLPAHNYGLFCWLLQKWTTQVFCHKISQFPRLP